MRSVVWRALESYDNLKGAVQSGRGKGKRLHGAGRKAAVPEIGAAMFSWFIDVRSGLKGRISNQMFLSKCKQLHEAYLVNKRKAGQEISEEELNMKFSKSWVRDWKKNYRVSLRKPNKRYALKNSVRKDRILEFLKNIYRVRHFMLTKYKTDPVIWSGDQMPLHRLESANSKTLSMKAEDCHVKENYMHSRERVTTYTQMTSKTLTNLQSLNLYSRAKGRESSLRHQEG